MQCQSCKEDFISTEWAKDKDLFNQKYIVCDDCLLYILKARRAILGFQLNSLSKEISYLDSKIGFQVKWTKQVSESLNSDKNEDNFKREYKTDWVRREYYNK